MDSSLPVVQLKESHALKLDPDHRPGGGSFTLVLAAYPRMTAGDKVSLNWQGYFDDGGEDSPYTNTKTVMPADIGHPLIWSLDSSYVMFIANGSAQMSYQLVYADAQGGTADSEIQTLDIVPPPTSRLPLVEIENHSGPAIDPGDFPSGVKLNAAAYPGIQVGDYVLLYAIGAPGSTRGIKSLQVDQSMIDRGELSFSLEHQWLQDQLGETVSLDYQYARPGTGESSSVLSVEVRAAWRPAAPIIQGALPESGDPPPINQGYISAWDGRSGVVVRIPADTELGATDSIEVQWQGYGSFGCYIATVPVADDPRKFAIPAHAVPANMGKRLDVLYKITRPGEFEARSVAFDLRIVPVPRKQFSTIQSGCVDGKSLLLSCIPSSGLELTLNRWLYMAAGQLLSIQVVSFTSEFVLENFLIEEAHVTAGKVVAHLRRGFLEGLNIGVDVTFNVSVSFDEGFSHTVFPQLSLVLAT